MWPQHHLEKEVHVTQLFSIGAVSALVGVHPQTLREYERRGLVVPARTPGGTRRYSDRDLVRLSHVQRLTAEGMSLAAVAYVLDLEDRLARATERLSRLEGRRSVSVALVHVPRKPRSPRWRNE
jgi:MerR family transcriptional regulator/heat shock protein HspR